MTTPDEIAAMAMFLLSGKSPDLTGVNPALTD